MLGMSIPSELGGSLEPRHPCPSGERHALIFPLISSDSSVRADSKVGVWTMGKGLRRDVELERRWRTLVEDQGRSGLSIRAFCGERGVSASSFRFWKRRVGDRHEIGTHRGGEHRRIKGAQPTIASTCWMPDEVSRCRRRKRCSPRQPSESSPTPFGSSRNRPAEMSSTEQRRFTMFGPTPWNPSLNAGALGR